MINKRFLWLLLFAALIMSGSALLAQAPAGPEKAMIYNGEQLKIQLTGDLRLNMVENQFNVFNDTYGLWVNNQKYGALTLLNFAALGAPIPTLQGSQSLWLKWPSALTRGSLIFDVRYSQIGLTITGPGVLGGTTFGRFEMDFYGGFGTTAGNVSRQPLLRMRNAFAGLAWQKEVFGFKLTFGQFTSLNTPVLAYPVGLSPLPFFEKGVLFDWDQGILASFVFGTAKVNLMLDVDIARAKSGTDAAGFVTTGTTAPAAGAGIGTPALYPGEGFGNNDERGNGEASMKPAWHGRVAFNLNPDPIFGLMIAVNGHYYQQHNQLFHANWTLYGAGNPSFYPRAADVPSKSVGAQAKVSVWIFTIQGAGWLGENMVNYLGGFGAGVRESLSGNKNLPDKGRGGYAAFYVVGPKVGIPVMLFFQMGQELKNNSNRIPYTTGLGTTLGISTTTYGLSNLGGSTGATGSIMANSEISGGLWIFLNAYTKIGYEAGLMDTKFKGVNGSSANIFHRLAMSYTF